MGCRAGPGPVRTWCRSLPARDLCHRLVLLCCCGLHRGYFPLGCALSPGRDRNIQWWCTGWDLKRKVHYMSTMMINTKREPKPATGWYPQKKVHHLSWFGVKIVPRPSVDVSLKKIKWTLFLNYWYSCNGQFTLNKIVHLSHDALLHDVTSLLVSLLQFCVWDYEKVYLDKWW